MFRTEAPSYPIAKSGVTADQGHCSEHWQMHTSCLQQNWMAGQSSLKIVNSMLFSYEQLKAAGWLTRSAILSTTKFPIPFTFLYKYKQIIKVQLLVRERMGAAPRDQEETRLVPVRSSHLASGGRHLARPPAHACRMGALVALTLPSGTLTPSPSRA